MPNHRLSGPQLGLLARSPHLAVFSLTRGLEMDYGGILEPYVLTLFLGSYQKEGS